MAKKVPAKKPASKATPKAAVSKKAASPAVKKSPAKSAPKKAETRKSATATPVKKVEAKKPEAKKVEAKKVEAKKVEAKKPDAKKVDAKPVTAIKPASKPDAKAPVPAKKAAPAVAPRPPAVKKVKPPLQPIMPPGIGRLIVDGKGPRKPLISSGPKAAHVKPLGAHGDMYEESATPIAKPKTVYSKKQLEDFRQILLRKRGELAGDVVAMEGQALQGSSGSLSNMPSHMAEQGSEAYDQSLSLELADKNRKLIREIDDALTRIEEGSYGMCELTGKAIPIDRLTELPWVRYTIEAQRELDRQQMTRQ